MTTYLTRAEMLDKIEAHFRQPGAMLSRHEESYKCFYAHPDDGRPCAIGVLIPVKMRKCIGGLTVKLIPDEILESAGIGTDNVDWAALVQRAHDSALDVPDFLKRLATFRAGLAA